MRILKGFLQDLGFLAGAGAAIYGVHLVYHPASLVIGGLFCAWFFIPSRLKKG